MSWDGINVLGCAPLALHADLRAQLTGRKRPRRRAVSMREWSEGQGLAARTERMLDPLA